MTDLTKTIEAIKDLDPQQEYSFHCNTQGSNAGHFDVASLQALALEYERLRDELEMVSGAVERYTGFLNKF